MTPNRNFDRSPWDDQHGIGPYLLAALELMEIEK